MIEYEKLFEYNSRKQVQVYFNDDSGLYDIKVKAETVDKIIIVMLLKLLLIFT